MAIEWLAGNRLRGTTAERPALGLPSGSVGGWVEVGRTTLGSANADITVSSLADKKYYMILGNYDRSGTGNFALRLNSDTGSNYSSRQSFSGGADGTNVSQTRYGIDAGGTVGKDEFFVSYIANLSNKEKLLVTHEIQQNTAGAGNAPARTESVGKWSNTSDSVNAVTLNGSTTATSGSELVVLGWDPTDTHTTNFWEELASVEYSGGTALDSGTFTSKKYLWIQAYLKIATGTVNSNLWRFNADTGNNYTARYSRDGASDSTNTSISHLNINHGSGTKNNQLVNIFVINNASNEKLIISNSNSQGASGSGTAPNRIEYVGKWANTSNQITSIQCTQGNSLNFESGTILKVWGSD